MEKRERLSDRYVSDSTGSLQSNDGLLPDTVLIPSGSLQGLKLVIQESVLRRYKTMHKTCSSATVGFTGHDKKLISSHKPRI